MTYNVYLPPTKGEWKGAKTPFDKFVLPQWDGVVPEAIDQKSFQKIQIAVQSSPAISGQLYVDNIYIYGGSGCVCSDGVVNGLNRNNSASMSR